MSLGFDWNITPLGSPWSELDGPELASKVGALQLVQENQGSPLKLHVLASIAVGLPQRASPAPIRPADLHSLIGRPELQDPEGNGEFEITDLFCNEIELQGLPFRFIAGSGTSSHTKMEYLARSILTIAGRDLPVAFLEPAADLIFAVAHLSEMICARARIARTRTRPNTEADTVVVPTTATLRALEHAVRYPLDSLSAEMLTALLPLASAPGDQFDVYPGFSSEMVAVKPLLLTGSHLIVVCPGELAGALSVQLQTLAAQAGCLPELSRAHRAYVSAYIHHIVAAGGVNFDDPTRHPDLGIDLISGDLEGQGIHLVVEVDPLLDYDPAEPFGLWFATNKDDQIASLIPPSPEVPPVVVLCTVSTSRGQARFGSGIPGVNLLVLEAPDLITLFKLKWNDHPWDLVRFARAIKKLEETTQIFSESLLGEYGVYDDNHNSFYLSDDALPTSLVIGGQYSLKYRAAERAKFDEHLVAVSDGSLRSVSLSGIEYAPIYMLFDRVPALSIELDNIFVWVRAQVVGQDAPVIELLEGVTYWIWQIIEAVNHQISHRQLRVLLTIDMSETGDSIEAQRIDDVQFHLTVRPKVGLAKKPLSNEFDRVLVSALLTSIFGPICDGDLDIVATLEQVAPVGDKRMFLIGSDPIPELHDPRIAALSRTVPDSITAEVLDHLGQQLFSRDRYPVGDIPAEQTTEILNEAVRLHYQRLLQLIERYDSVHLIERLMGQSAGLEVATRIERMRRVTRIACYGSEHYPPSKLRREDSERVESSLGVRFLVELISAIGSSGRCVPNDDEYDLLVALAVEIALKGMQSDASHYGLSDVLTSRLKSGRLGTSQDDRWATGLVNHSELLIARQLHGEPDRDDENDTWDFNDQENLAFTAEFGFTVHEMRIGIAALYADIPRNERTPAVVVASRTNVIAAIVGRTGWNAERAASLLDLYTLGPVASFTLDAETGPWRFGRSRSYIRQPVVSIDEAPEGMLRWSPSRLLHAVAELVALYRTGRLKGHAKEMKAALGSVRQSSNLEFERRVAARYRLLGYGKVHERVTSWASVPLIDVDGSNLGDIDVLVINDEEQKILVVEAKDFETARTPIEMSREMAKLRNEAVKKSHRRADWVRDHLDLFTDSTTGWVVEEFIVTSRRSTAVATGNGHETVMAFDDLGY